MGKKCPLFPSFFINNHISPVYQRWYTVFIISAISFTIWAFGSLRRCFCRKRLIIGAYCGCYGCDAIAGMLPIPLIPTQDVSLFSYTYFKVSTRSRPRQHRYITSVYYPFAASRLSFSHSSKRSNKITTCKKHGRGQIIVVTSTNSCHVCLKHG